MLFKVYVEDSILVSVCHVLAFIRSIINHSHVAEDQVDRKLPALAEHELPLKI